MAATNGNGFLFFTQPATCPLFPVRASPSRFAPPHKSNASARCRESIAAMLASTDYVVRLPSVTY
jgi:hypothetical protein